jgi:hypothetical protein
MKTDVSCLTPSRELSRRTFLGTAASTTMGLAGVLATNTPPLYAAARTLTMLTWNHFVPASDTDPLYVLHHWQEVPGGERLLGRG